MPVWLDCLLWGVTLLATHGTAYFVGKTAAFNYMARQSRLDAETSFSRIRKLLGEGEK